MTPSAIGWRAFAMSESVIATGDQATVTLKPQVRFRCDKCTVTQGFEVLDVQIENWPEEWVNVKGAIIDPAQSQLAAYRQGLSFDVCRAFGRIIFVVCRTEEGLAVFNATLDGFADGVCV
jgi:hypothetical protein